MDRPWHDFICVWLKRHEWTLVLVIVLLAFALGLIGIHQHQLALGKTMLLADAIYFTLRLYTFSFDLAGEGAPYAESNLALYLAKYLAPLPLFYAGIKAILLLAYRRIGLLRIRQWSNHVLVCGAGMRGSLVALNLQKAGRNVVLIEKDAGNSALGKLRNYGIQVIVGDASDEICLKAARIEYASIVIALTSSEETNLKVAHFACRTCIDSSTVIKAHVSRHFAEAFQSLKLFPIRRDSAQIRFFDHSGSAARQLIREFGPNLAKLSCTSPRILLIGDGDIIIELLKNFVILGQYPVGRGPQIQIVTLSENYHRRFPSKHPQLNLVCDITFTSLSTETVAAVEASAGFDLALVAFNQDEQTILTARRLSQSQNINNGTVVACLRPSLDILPSLNVSESATGVFFRDIVGLGCETEVLLHDALDHSARLIHERYVSTQYSRGQTLESNPSLVPWDYLPEELRQANRAQADHDLIKRATLEVATDPITLEALSEAEHRRWMAEKIVGFWRYGPIRDDLRKLHPSIVPYAALSEVERQKDRDVILTLANSTKNHND